MKLNSDKVKRELQDESTPKNNQGKTKRKVAFNLPIPKKRRTGPRQQSFSTAEKPSEWLLMLSYKILTENDPHLAMVLSEVASSIDDRERDLIGTLVNMRAKLRAAEEEARIMGEEVKAAKEEEVRALVAKDKAEQNVESLLEREKSLKSDMEEQVKAIKSLNLLVARHEQEIEEGKEEYIRSMESRRTMVLALSAGMKLGIREAVKKFSHLDPSVVEFLPRSKALYGFTIAEQIKFCESYC